MEKEKTITHELEIGMSNGETYKLYDVRGSEVEKIIDDIQENLGNEGWIVYRHVAYKGVKTVYLRYSEIVSVIHRTKEE